MPAAIENPAPVEGSSALDIFKAYREQTKVFKANVHNFQAFFTNKIKSTDKAYNTVLDQLKIVAEADLKNRLKIKAAEHLLATNSKEKKVLENVQKMVGLLKDNAIPIFKRLNKEVHAFYATKASSGGQAPQPEDQDKENLGEGLGDKIVAGVNASIGLIKDKFIDDFMEHVQDFLTSSRMINSLIITDPGTVMTNQQTGPDENGFFWRMVPDNIDPKAMRDVPRNKDGNIPFDKDGDIMQYKNGVWSKLKFAINGTSMVYTQWRKAKAAQKHYKPGKRYNKYP